jgi:outer membrane protein assembly factor BamA
VKALVLLVALSVPAYADDSPLAPVQADQNTCNKLEQQQQQQPIANEATIALKYYDFEVSGELIDPPGTLRALMEPAMQSGGQVLSEGHRREIVDAAGKIGYEVVAISAKEVGDKTHAVLFLAPRPIVRKVDIAVQQSLFDTLIDDQVRSHMHLRIGSYLPWKPLDRACVLLEEKAALEDFLRSEGYFEVSVNVEPTIDRVAVKLRVAISLGPEYRVGAITIADTGPLAIDVATISSQFKHEKCILRLICYGGDRFTRQQHEEDKKRVARLFQKRGYPAVRVQSDVDYTKSFDRFSRTVPFTLTIDQRRKVEVVFEGNDPDSITTEQLTNQLTFNEAGSADDVEAAASAKAITKYLQGRGYFDAKVTWTRERFSFEDKLVFGIEAGRPREVSGVTFVGNKALTVDQLDAVIATKEVKLSQSLFGNDLATTSDQLSEDVGRIKDAYRRAGYRDARVRVSASSEAAGLDSAALTAALVTSRHGDGLYVRYAIEEGPPTLLGRVEIANEDGDITLRGTPRPPPPPGQPPYVSDTRVTVELCDKVLAQLADQLPKAKIGKRTGPRCMADSGEPFREDDVATTKDTLREYLFNTGRPRAQVEYAATTERGPHTIVAHYKLTRLDELRIGKVVIRGNFHTRSSVIIDELRFKEGQALTTDALADGARRLRETGLFDAVNIEPLDLTTTSSDSVHAVVVVEERYDYRASIEAELGYSSYSGVFVKLLPSARNLWGLGMSLDLNGTLGFDPGVLAATGNFQLKALLGEATFTIPTWLVRRVSPVDFQTQLTGFYNIQDTPRFGQLTTEGATIALARTFTRQRSAKAPARALTFGLHYDFRLRERNVDALRPIGADDDQSQVPISTRTGSIGATFEWEQRVDRHGTLQQLAPEEGFRWTAQASFASPALLGQDTFIKLLLSGTKYWSLGGRLILRSDFRYDQGIPLGGAVLLPEVERFFAGGDTTVRGYDDDRLATEIITVGVPPIANLDQIRIVPAGGNIRVMGSLDAEVHITKLLASGIFTDAGMITNTWSSVTVDDVKPSVGMSLARVVTPFGAFALEYAIPLRPHLGDDPRGRWHISFAARAQF